MKQLILFLVMSVAVSAQAQNTINIGPILTGQGTNAAKAEKIAREAEKLVHPAGFGVAKELFKIALRLDPKNKVAGFYTPYIDVIEHLRGLGQRVRPLIMLSGNQFNADAQRAKTKSASLIQFLDMGRPDIYTETHLQNYILSTQGSIDKLRAFVMANQEAQLELNLTDTAGWAKDVENPACTVKTIKAGESYQLAECLMNGRVKVKVNSADMVGLRQVVNGMKIAIALATSYETSGFFKTMDQSSGLKLTVKQFVERLRQLKSLGKLKSDKVLQTIPPMAADLLSTAKWAVKNANTVCGAGESDSENRAGYLFKYGLCVEQQTLDFYASMSTATPEPMKIEFWHQPTDPNNGDWVQEIVRTEVHPYAVFIKPVPDIKALLPNKFNSCGQAAGFPDPSLGGYLPKRDADRVYRYLGIMHQLGIASVDYWNNPETCTEQ